MLDDLDVDLDGAALLNELRALLTDYVVLPSDAAADAITLWVAATHALPAFQHAPRLAIRPAKKVREIPAARRHLRHLSCITSDGECNGGSGVPLPVG